MTASKAQELAASMSAPPIETSLTEPDAAQLLFDTEEPPPFPDMNIFPLEWRVETPKLQQIYDASRVPGWSPHTLPWDTLDPESFSMDERYSLPTGSPYYQSLTSRVRPSSPEPLFTLGRRMKKTRSANAFSPSCGTRSITKRSVNGPFKP